MERLRTNALIAASLALWLFSIGSASAIETRHLTAQKGDNSISFEWDHKERRVITATSSMRISDASRVRIMTSLRDQLDRIAMRSTLKNVSKDEVIVLDGRLVHKIWGEDGTLMRTLQSRLLTKRLQPGDHVRVRFSYQLPSGWYTTRSDFKPR